MKNSNEVEAMFDRIVQLYDRMGMLSEAARNRELHIHMDAHIRIVRGMDALGCFSAFAAWVLELPKPTSDDPNLVNFEQFIAAGEEYLNSIYETSRRSDGRQRTSYKD